MTKEEAQSLVEKAKDLLGEHFDAVQIFVTWNEESQTNVFKLGCGNWYARQGMAHEFINQDIAQENAFQLAARLKTDDE